MYVTDLVNGKLSGRRFGNLHFFVNSVRFISSVLKRTTINPDDVRIVCAINDENRAKLHGYNIGKPSDEAKIINFYTSTCFEGCDIMDKEGKTFIVSDGRNPNTLYDISTIIPQIIGRIRDSNYKTTIVHILSNTQYKGEVTYDDFKKLVDREFRLSELVIEEYNSDTERQRKAIFERYDKNHWMDRFIHVDENYFFSMDRNLLKKNLYDYKLKTEIYNNSCSLVKAYKENGFTVKTLEFEDYSDRLKAQNTARGTFEEAVEEYHAIKTSIRFGNRNERTDLLEVKYNYLKNAYYLVGIERIRELRYNVTLIKREIIKNSDKLVVKKIIEFIVNKINYQNPVPLADAKWYLQEIYDILDLKISATASKLHRYFIAKETKKTIGGKVTEFIELIREQNQLE